MTKDLRIYQHHNLTFDRGEEVSIQVDGKPVRAFKKEPLAVSLFAAGRNVLARSLKFHRPRGFFCLAGHCHSCLMTVDGKPNIRTCRTFPAEGQVVCSQGGFPKVTNDLLFAADFLFPSGLDYHSLLTRPRLVNRLMVKLAQKLASGARIPLTPGSKSPPPEEQECDVAVVGAGPAGVAAALGASRNKLSVVLIDEDPAVGGRLRYELEKVDLPGGDGPAPGMDFAANFQTLLDQSSVESWTGSSAIGYYPEGVLAVNRHDRLIALKPKRLVVCTGAMDQNLPFPGNDLPSIVSTRALRRLTTLYGICPAVQVFIVGTDIHALSLALHLPEIGVRVVGMVELGQQIAGPHQLANEVQRRGTPIFLNYRIKKAVGRFHLKGIKITPNTPGGQAIGFRCDMIAVSTPSAPAFHLLDQAGCTLKFDPTVGFINEPDKYGRTDVQNVFAAGEVVGADTIEKIVRQGRIAGLAAANDLVVDEKLKSKLENLTSKIDA